MIERLGLKISVSTLADWVAAGALALEPIAKLIRELVLSAHVMNADDTGLKVLDDKAPGGAKRGHLWFYVGDSTHCAVAYTPDWCKEGPGVFLSMREGGWLVADAYKGWDHLYKRAEHPLTVVGCWAHAPVLRRTRRQGRGARGRVAAPRAEALRSRANLEGCKREPRGATRATKARLDSPSSSAHSAA